MTECEAQKSQGHQAALAALVAVAMSGHVLLCIWPNHNPLYHLAGIGTCKGGVKTVVTIRLPQGLRHQVRGSHERDIEEQSCLHCCFPIRSWANSFSRELRRRHMVLVTRIPSCSVSEG